MSSKPEQEREPDIQFPDEAAIEERVRHLMDVSEPDATAKKSTTKSTEETDRRAPPSTKKPLVIPVASHEDDDNVVASAPLLPAAGATNLTARSDQQSTKKSIVITHYADSEKSAEPPAKNIVYLPDDTDSVPPPPDNPLIPTAMLAQTIDKQAAPPKKTAPKKTSVAPGRHAKKGRTKTVAPIVTPPETPLLLEQPDRATEPDAEITQSEPTARDKHNVDSNTAEQPATTEHLTPVGEPSAAPETETPDYPDIESEIAEAFKAEFDESMPEDADATQTSVTDSAQPVVAAPRPKFDKFTPLTDIRPQLPPAETPHGPLKLDDDLTSRAVADILVSDADNVLQLPSDLPTKTGTEAEPKLQRRGHRKLGLVLGLVLVLVCLSAVAIAIVPDLQRASLNKLGVYATATVSITDQATKLPLKDVTVMIADKSVTTNNQGQAMFTSIRFGSTKISVKRQAYAPVDRTVQFSLWSEKIVAISLVPTGTTHTLSVIDSLSGQPLPASIDSTYGSGVGDASGIIRYTLNIDQKQPFTATVSARGYKSKTVTVDPSKIDGGKVALVVSRRQAYVNKQTAAVDIYAVDVDGQNAKLLLKGTGNEQVKSTVIVPSPIDDQVAVLSTRSGEKAADGTLLSTLTLLNLTDSKSQAVVQAAQIQIIAWLGDRLIYTQILGDAKPADTNRQQLVSYSFKNKKTTVLATANYFNNVLSANGMIYYAPSSAYQSSSNVGFFAINPDGSGAIKLLPLETWNVYRTAFDHLSLSVQQDWYDYKFGDKQPVKQSAPPASLANRQYYESPDGQHALYFQTINGQPKLMLYDKRAATETTLQAPNGSREPLYWLTNAIFVYRVVSGSETANYANSIQADRPATKIQDVADVSGIKPWQVR
ncbi:MAG: hypothetical protein NVSMB37_4770 [Candidatus Saccharimonadales bacterium]